jgi:hypothetical protein
MWKSLALPFVLMMVASPLPALGYTQADADACTPDAMRLCMDAIPNERLVGACLFEKKLQLSPACTAVFNRARAATAAGSPALLHKTKF